MPTTLPYARGRTAPRGYALGVAEGVVEGGLGPGSDQPLVKEHDRRPWVGVAMAIAAACCFALNGSVSKVVLGTGISAERLVELRSAGAFLGLFLALLVLAPGRLRVSRRDLPVLALYGIAGFALVQWFYFLAIARLPVGIALLFEFTAPVLVAVWARFAWHEAVRRRVWAALVLSLLGLVLVAEVWSGGGLDPFGVAAGLGAAVSLALYFLVGERAVGRRDPVSLTCWALFFAALFWSLLQPWWTFPVSAFSGSTDLGGSLAGSTAPIWLLALFIIVVGSIAPFLLVVGALRHLPATRVGVVGMAEPVLAGAVAFVWLGEALSAVQLTGGAVVLAGIALAQTAR
jgi:drug/metabolite transporter (DMT)-like permease